MYTEEKDYQYIHGVRSLGMAAYILAEIITKTRTMAIDFKETRSVTMNIFRKKKSFLFKSFVKIELS